MSNTSEGFRIGGLGVLVIVGVFVLSILLASMSIFGWGWFQRSTADFRGQTDAIEQTKANADFRLSAYNSFFSQCSAIQGDEGRLKAQQGLLEQISDPAERSRILANIAALEGSRVAKIRSYNADAAKSFTDGQFRDSKLPYQINPDQKETQCAVG